MTLLRQIQELTENTYDQRPEINLEKFLVGRKRFIDLSRVARTYVYELSDTARVFFRIAGKNLYLAVYYSDHLIEALEKNDPRNGLNEKNITEFMIFIEEINHAFHTSLKFLEGESDLTEEEFLNNLELQGKIDVYLILEFFLAYFNPSKKLERLDKLWIRYHVFERSDCEYDDQVLTQRYEQANELGSKYVRFLDCLSLKERVQEIRRFRALEYEQKKNYVCLLP